MGNLYVTVLEIVSALRTNAVFLTGVVLGNYRVGSVLVLLAPLTSPFHLKRRGGGGASVRYDLTSRRSDLSVGRVLSLVSPAPFRSTSMVFGERPSAGKERSLGTRGVHSKRGMFRSEYSIIDRRSAGRVSEYRGFSRCVHANSDDTLLGSLT